MLRNLLIALALLCASFASAAPHQHALQYVVLLDDTYTSTVSSGTGFTLTDGEYIFLISNRHVYSHPQIRIYYMSEDGRLGVLDPRKMPGWKYVESERHDIAAFAAPLDLITEELSRSRRPMLAMLDYEASIATPEELEEIGVGVGSRAFTYGFPARFNDISVGRRSILPIAAGCTVATPPGLEVNDFRAYPRSFFIDGHIFGGNSGSPVFADRSDWPDKNTPIILGLIYRGINDPVFGTETDLVLCHNGQVIENMIEYLRAVLE